MSITNQHLRTILKNCSLNKRKAQRELYANYYSYALSIAFQHNREPDSIMVVNESFLNIFLSLEGKDTADFSVFVFKEWIRNVIIKTCEEKRRKKVNSIRKPFFSEEQGFLKTKH